VLPGASTDDSLNTFRAELAAVATRRIYAALARLVRTDDFFWERDFGRSYDPRRPAVDNLAQALSLEAQNGGGWNGSRRFGRGRGRTAPIAARRGLRASASVL
jgi:hypothetical protein